MGPNRRQKSAPEPTTRRRKRNFSTKENDCGSASVAEKGIIIEPPQDTRWSRRSSWVVAGERNCHGEATIYESPEAIKMDLLERRPAGPDWVCGERSFWLASVWSNPGGSRTAITSRSTSESHSSVHCGACKSIREGIPEPRRGLAKHSTGKCVSLPGPLQVFSDCLTKTFACNGYDVSDLPHSALRRRPGRDFG
jgi:hypothetical protein